MESSEPLTARGRRTRSNLITAARVIFERDGFVHARIADICIEADAAQGSFYTYFPNKEAVFREVVNSVELDMLPFGRGISSDDPVEQIRQANRHYLESYRDNAAIMRVVIQVSTFDPEIMQTLVARENEFGAALEKRIRQLQTEGLVTREIDPRYAAFALGGMVGDFAEQMYVQGLAADLDTAVDQLTLLWARALGL